MIAIDSSVLVAILRGGAEARTFAEIIAWAHSRALSAVSALETAMILSGRAGTAETLAPLDAFLARAAIAVVPFDGEQAEIARAAFLKYGKGRHPAALNMGDCAAYALAKSRKCPLLFKGEDFSKTDIGSAMDVRR